MQCLASWAKVGAAPLMHKYLESKLWHDFNITETVPEYAFDICTMVVCDENGGTVVTMLGVFKG